MMIRVVVVRLLLRSAAPEDDHPGGGGRGRHSPMVLVKDERDDRMEKMHRVLKDILEKTKSSIMQTLNLKKQE